MAKTNIIIRSDDWDFRFGIERYQLVHREFAKRNLVETANLQFCQHGTLTPFNETLVNYLLNTKGYDIQLHCWEHILYATMSEAVITRDLAAASYYFMKYFKRLPSVWYPPWNMVSQKMIEVADKFGMKVDNESYDIKRFIREAKEGSFSGHSFYFHGSMEPDLACLPEALDLVLALDKGVN